MGTFYSHVLIQYAQEGLVLFYIYAHIFHNCSLYSHVPSYDEPQDLVLWYYAFNQSAISNGTHTKHKIS